MSNQTKQNKLIKEAAFALGRAGGLANVKAHGKAHMKRISKLAAQARKALKVKSQNIQKDAE